MGKHRRAAFWTVFRRGFFLRFRGARVVLSAVEVIVGVFSCGRDGGASE